MLPVWIRNSKLLIQEVAGPVTQVLYDVRDNTWPVFVDPRELELAVVNVVLNASEAMPMGGQLRIATRNIRLPDGQSELTPGRYVGAEEIEDDAEPIDAEEIGEEDDASEADDDADHSIAVDPARP